MLPTNKQILETTDEFCLIQYILQIFLSSPQLKIDECYDISRENGNINFERYISKMPNSNIVDIFIPLNKLQQPLSDIIKHGIRVNSKNGFKIQTNFVNLEPKQQIYECIHCVVALGIIMNHEKDNSPLSQTIYNNNEADESYLRYDCDSLRISDQNEFLIFTNQQIKALHYIKFKGGENLTSKFPILNKCGVCGNNNATLFCENDNLKLCLKCDQDTHKVNQIFQSHVRNDLFQNYSQSQMCEFHPLNRTSYYCPKCHIPVCVECKISGNHSKGEASKHQLINLSDIYEKTKKSFENSNEIYEFRNKTLNERLIEINEMIENIENNEKNVKLEIERIAQKAIQETHEIFHNRAIQLKSAKIEINRKLKELENQKTFINLHCKSSEPSIFLRSVFASEILDKEINQELDLPLIPNDNGEVHVKGSILIEIDDPIPLKNQHPKKEINLKNEDLNNNSNIESEDFDPKIISLNKMSLRKQSKYLSQGLEFQFIPFNGSQILTDHEISKVLYLCFPFRAQPETHLMYSSIKDGRSVQKIHKLIDNMGITTILIKSGENIFGGFAASKWNSDGKPFGENSSTFLFSINKDAFIPYKPQSEDPCYLYATKDIISFGKDDLRLEGDLDKCYSTIENSFGLGFKFMGEKAKTFLAGSSEFKADIVEVWGFFSN